MRSDCKLQYKIEEHFVPLVIINGLIPFLWNMFTTHQTFRGQQECDFSILVRSRGRLGRFWHVRLKKKIVFKPFGLNLCQRIRRELDNFWLINNDDIVIWAALSVHVSCRQRGFTATLVLAQCSSLACSCLLTEPTLSTSTIWYYCSNHYTGRRGVRVTLSLFHS